MTCPNCQSQNTQNWNYCSYCGQQLKKIKTVELFLGRLDKNHEFFRYPRTFWKLLSTPKFFFNTYFSGRTKSFIGPITFFFTSIAFQFIVMKGLSDSYYYGGSELFKDFGFLDELTDLILSIGLSGMYYLIFRHIRSFVEVFYFFLYVLGFANVILIIPKWFVLSNIISKVAPTDVLFYSYLIEALLYTMIFIRMNLSFFTIRDKTKSTRIGLVVLAGLNGFVFLLSRIIKIISAFYIQ